MPGSVADSLVGTVNLVQLLPIQAYHDAHHYDRVGARIRNPEYGGAAAAGKRR